MNSRHVLTQLAFGASLFLCVACEPSSIEPVLTEAPMTPATRLMFPPDTEPGIDHQGRQLGGLDSRSLIPTSASIDDGLWWTSDSGWILSARDGQLNVERYGTRLSEATLRGREVSLSGGHTLSIIEDQSHRTPAGSVLGKEYRVSYDHAPVCGGGWVLFVPGDWTSAYHHDPERVSLACVKDSVIAKCLDWGYGPYQSGPQEVQYHEVCVRMARADYCGNGQSHTFDGTPINIYDRRDVDGDPSTQQIKDYVRHDLPLEAVWGGGTPGQEFDPPRALCLSKLRWQTLPPEPCGGSSYLPDPRIRDNCSLARAAFCEDLTEEQWRARGGILFTRSPFYDKGLYRWRSVTTGDRYLTTSYGFYDNSHGSEPPAPDFRAERFEGIVFTKKLVPPEKLDTMVALCSSRSGGPDITSSDECLDGRTREGFIFRSADVIPSEDGDAIGSAWRYLKVYQNSAGRYVSTTSPEELSADWRPINTLGIVLQTPTPLPPPSLASPCNAHAWAWAHSPTATAAYSPSSTYAYNSRGEAITIARLSTGRYQVNLTGIEQASGNVQVVSYGYSGERCKVVQWDAWTSSIFVQCHDRVGQATDARFVVWFEGRGGAAEAGENKAYLLADQPKRQEMYVPNTTSQWNSSGQLSTVTRTAAGVYSVRLTGQRSVSRSSVRVTAYGEGLEYCKVASWGTLGNDVFGNVRCFGSSGIPADSAFSLSFASERVFDRLRFEGSIWAHDPGATSYVPNTSYNYNSSYGSPLNTASRTSTGNYLVDYPSLYPASLSSSAMVTAYGVGPEHCQVVSWYRSPSTIGDERVSIRCWGSQGLVDTRYVAAFVHRGTLLY